MRERAARSPLFTRSVPMWAFMFLPIAYGQLGPREAMGDAAAKQRASISLQRESAANGRREVAQNSFRHNVERRGRSERDFLPCLAARNSALCASIRVQQAAVGRPGASLNARPLTSTFFAEPECEPLSAMEMAPLIDDAAEKDGLSSDLLRAVIRRESAFRPCAVSSKGALGLMQLMPATARGLGVVDPFDPKENVEGGARLLRELMDRYTGDLSRVLGAYNAGPARVDAADGIPQLTETLAYVDTILRDLRPKQDEREWADPLR